MEWRKTSVQSILVVMTKDPAAGKVKTRLSPPLSPAQAAKLYDCFLQDRLNEMSLLPNIDKAIAYMPESAESVFKRYAMDQFTIFPQRGQNLGQRMHHIFADKFNEGYGAVVVIGSDSPDLPASIISKAFNILIAGTTDIVLGPARDGGYYLIGLKEEIPELFTDISWGIDTVLSTTLKKAKHLGIQSALLPIWSDIDTYQDLVAFYTRNTASISHQHTVAAKTIAYAKQLMGNLNFS